MIHSSMTLRYWSIKQSVMLCLIGQQYILFTSHHLQPACLWYLTKILHALFIHFLGLVSGWSLFLFLSGIWYIPNLATVVDPIWIHDQFSRAFSAKFQLLHDPIVGCSSETFIKPKWYEGKNLCGKNLWAFPDPKMTYQNIPNNIFITTVLCFLFQLIKKEKTIFLMNKWKNCYQVTADTVIIRHTFMC